MSEKNSKARPAPALQETEVTSAESAELQKALAEFRGILEKAEVPLVKNEVGGSEKPGR